MSRDRRRLGPEEEALWSAVKRSVVPLRRERQQPPAAPEPPPKPPVPDAAPARPADIAAAAAPKAAPPVRPTLPTLHTLGRRERQRIVRGTASVDARLDLHGFRQDEAHARLSGFLAMAQAHGHRVVLVITGKGRPGGGFETLHEPERGVLRRVVPLWLSLPEFRRYVLGFEEAHLAHGGAGAIYVRIRRRKG